MKRLTTLIAASLLSAQAMAADKVELLLDWFINPDHAPLIVAQQQGYFAEQELEVSMVEPADPSMPPKLVAAGKADLALTYQPQLHVMVDEELPLTRIGTLIATPLNSLVVLEDGPVKSIADLKGRKVGYSVGGYEEALMRAMLAPHDLSLDDIEMINVNWSLSPSLIAGKVDAVIGAYRNFELNQMDLEGHPGRAFYIEEEGVPAYDELVLVINNKDRGDDRFARFVAALEKATQYIVNHPDAAWKSFVSYKPDELDTELNRRAWADTLSRFALRPAALDEARYQRVGAFMQEQGLTDSNPPVADYAIVP
ncbi:ABC transporter substrate-binding protein [Marinobacterium mangrovicola]|uniref:Putative hydroxymethylpyrimidine transport system substrate-binding protein n=1 Tax=Marinobacterium mangrovicola TaxID=1476959 RepID=A0A4R1GAK9_9GAMM|nr:ABC transporter substrate-binding protein [Marinobacterium mangrovicola]TCK03700.1 putative hydroxymethylpyrimidine transport system substrate-binding protein [Marinobacterium mangrovicola]